MGKESDTAGKLQQHYDKIVRAMRNEVPTQFAGFSDFTPIRTSSALTEVSLAEIKYFTDNARVDGKGHPIPPRTLPIIAKKYLPRPANLPERYMHHYPDVESAIALDYQQYLFSHELFAGDNSPLVPKPYSIEELPDFLFMDAVGVRTIEAALDNGKAGAVKGKLKDFVRSDLARFHVRSESFLTGLLAGHLPAFERVTAKLQSQIEREKRIGTSATEYFIMLQEFLKGGLSSNQKEYYKALFSIVGEEYSTVRDAALCFGDPVFTNIVEGWQGKYFMIDPKLVLRKRPLEISNIVTSPGSTYTPQEAIELLDSFEIGIDEARGVQARIGGLGHNEEIRRGKRRVLIMGMIAEPLRKMLKNLESRAYVGERYRDQVRNRPRFQNANKKMLDISFAASSYALSNPAALQIDADGQKRLKELHYELFEAGDSLLTQKLLRVPDTDMEETQRLEPIKSNT